MAKARIQDGDGDRAVADATAGSRDRQTMATATRYLLQLLADRVPGNSVEVRVPPYGAVQCVEGPRHTRGTPPNVVEMAPDVWVALAVGSRTWRDAVDSGAVQASGSRADIEALLPVWRAPVIR
jgi:Bacterial SCP ortholog